MGVFQDIRKAITEYDNDLAVASAKKIVEQKLDLAKTIDVMAEVVREVGEGYAKGELFLPDLVGAGEAMSSAMKIIEEELKRKGERRQGLGTAAVGTVRGDIHSIGKDMLATLLTVEGFIVRDLGVDVRPEMFVEAVSQYDADILCMSSLLTVSAPEQKAVIESLKERGLRDKVKVMVGGGAISQGFANSIGADGYHPTAVGGAKLARELMGK